MRRSLSSRPLLWVGLGWLVFALPWLMRKAYIPFDALDEFFPQALFNARSLIEGELPLWNPYQFAGFSNVGDPQGMVFSPLMNLLMIIGQGDFLYAFHLAVFLHVLIGGIGILLCAKDRGTAEPIAVIAAAVYMFGGVAASRLQHTPMILGYAFLPYCYLFLTRVVAAPRLSNAAMLGMSGALLLVHGTQVTYLAILLLVFYVAFNLRDAVRKDRFVHLSLGAVIAVALALPFLHAVLTSIITSNRPSIPYSQLLENSGSISPRALFGFTMPGYTGASTGNPWVGELTSNYFYVGLVPLFLLAATQGLKTRNAFIKREGDCLLFALVFYFLYALGPTTIVYEWLYTLVPGVNLFRRPNDAMFLVNAVLALILLRIDSTALSTALERIRTKHEVTFAIGIACVAIAVAGWISYEPKSGYGTPVTCFVATTLAALLVFRAASKRASLVWLLPLAAIVDLTAAGSAKAFNRAAPDYVHQVFSTNAQNPLGAWLRERLLDPSGLPYRIENVDAWMMWRNVPTIERLHSSLGYNPLVDGNYRKFYGAPESSQSARRDDGTGYRSVYFRLLGVRYVVTSGELSQLDHDFSAALNGPVADIANTRVYFAENSHSRILNPRSSIITHSSTQLDDFDPASVVEIDKETIRNQLAIPKIQECSGRMSYKVISYRNNELTVSYTAEAPAWFVLSDTYHPWWRAEAEGISLPVYRANKAFRAVCLPAGSGTMRMTFGFPWLRGFARD